jgi:hypothetical protein
MSELGNQKTVSQCKIVNMASTADSDTDADKYPAAEQNALLKSLLHANQKICSLLEVLVVNSAHLERSESAAEGSELEQSKPDPVPLVGRVLLQNDFDLPEFSYSQLLQTSENDSFHFNPRYLPAENHTHEDLRAHVNRPY